MLYDEPTPKPPPSPLNTTLPVSHPLLSGGVNVAKGSPIDAHEAWTASLEAANATAMQALACTNRRCVMPAQFRITETLSVLAALSRSHATRSCITGFGFLNTLSSNVHKGITVGGCVLQIPQDSFHTRMYSMHLHRANSR